MHKSLLLIFLLLLVSCSSHELDVLFDQAERNIQPEPEKAYALLSTIDSKNISSRSQQARYALLMSHAMYKCYRDAPNDSLISIAYDYYVSDGHGSDHDRMTAAILRGAVLDNLEQTERAMGYYQKSLRYALKTDDYFMIGQIYTHLSALCLYIYDSDEQLYAKKAIEYYKRADAVGYSTDAMAQMARVYYERNELDSSLLIADSAYMLALELSDTVTITKSLYAMSLVNIAKKDYLKAKNNYDELRKIKKQLSPKDLTALASIHLGLNNTDSASLYIAEAKRQPKSNFDRINYFLTASSVSQAQDDYADALSNFKQMHHLRDSILTLRLSKSVNAEQRNAVQQELLIEKMQNRHRTLFGLMICLILVLVSLFLVYNYHKLQQLRKLEMEKNMLLVAEIRQSLQNKQSEVDTLSGQVSSIKAESARARNLIAGLFAKQFSTLDSLFVTYFSGQNIMYEKNAIYKEVQRIVKSFSSDQSTFLEIENLVNQEYDGILVNLRQDFPTMKEVDYRLFCFAAVGFSSRAISLLVDETVENVYQKRTRWKSKIEKSTSRRKQDYLAILG